MNLFVRVGGGAQVRVAKVTVASRGFNIRNTYILVQVCGHKHMHRSSFMVGRGPATIEYTAFI